MRTRANSGRALAESPAGGGDADLDLRAAFGALLGALPKEMLGKIIPAERAVMLWRVSRGAREALAIVQPAATVKGRGTGIKIIGLAGMLENMLSWCRITALHLRGELADVQCLVGVLGQCRSLAHLDLSDNRIGARGAGRLAKLLGQCGSLAHLNLSCNSIGAEGAGRLAEVAEQCPSLQIIS